VPWAGPPAPPAPTEIVSADPFTDTPVELINPPAPPPPACLEAPPPPPATTNKSIAVTSDGVVQLQVPILLNATYVYPLLVVLAIEQDENVVPVVVAVAGPFPTELTARI
jgi:hypothetical protein